MNDAGDDDDCTCTVGNDIGGVGCPWHERRWAPVQRALNYAGLIGMILVGIMLWLISP